MPVGVTRFREGLCRIDPYTPAQAAAVLDQVEAFAASFLKKHSTHLAWCSDEFYLLAGRPLPEKGYYEDMAQMENGVGMLRLLTSQAGYGPGGHGAGGGPAAVCHCHRRVRCPLLAENR